jgi:hypothetical protein
MTTKPKRTIYRATRDVLTAYDESSDILRRMVDPLTAARLSARVLDEQMQGDPEVITQLRASLGDVNRMLNEARSNSLDAPMAALREAFNAEKVASGIRAQATYDRRLTPEKRAATIARTEARLERLRATDGQ